jgi:hypothetical protein
MKQRDLYVKEICRDVFREAIAAASEKDEAKTKNISW